MNKLTAEKCREQIAEWERMMSVCDIAVMVERHLQAYRIALPILEQQERDEWIEWDGGDCPVYSGELVDLKLRDGRVTKSFFAGGGDWQCHGYGTDIIAYRIIPEQPTSQNGEQ